MDSFASVIPYRCWNVEGELDLRGTGIMVGHHLRGPSPEQSDAADLASRVRQFAGAILHLGTNDAVHVVYNRVCAPPPAVRHYEHRAAALVNAEQRAQFEAREHWLTPTSLYLTHLYEGQTKSLFRTLLLAGQGPKKQVQRELLRDYALQRFASFVDAASTAVGLSRMTSEEMFRDLMLNVTYHTFPAALPDASVRLNEVIGDEWQVNGLDPFINGYHLRPVCITAYSSHTVPQILAVLLRQKGEMLISVRFTCLDGYDAQETLKNEKKHWNREILGSLWAMLLRVISRSTPQANQDQADQLADIDAAIAASRQGLAFGHVTVTAIPRDKDRAVADMRAGELVKECHAMGIKARLEEMNAPEAIESSWPGNVTSNLRRTLINGLNFGDLMMPAHYWHGLRYIDSEMFPPDTPTPLIFSGSGREPFWYPPYINGVGNQLLIGPVGTGKSSLLGTMVAAYMGVPAARVVVLDIDYSSFVLTHLMGGEYRDLGSPDTPPLNPLAFLDHPGGLSFLYGWFERLFKRWKDFELSERAFEDFGEVLRKAKKLGVRDLVSLRALIHSDGPGEREKIRRILQQYIVAWGHIFNAEGAVPNEPLPALSVFEMRGLMSYDQRVSGPATEIVLQSILSRLDGTSPCWVLIDEAWAFISDKTSADWFFDALRAGRKKKVAYVLATQSLTEIVNHPYRALLLESCPGKVFLPNSEARGSHVAQMYLSLGLNEHEISIISSASSRREYFFRSPIGSRLFALQLGNLGKAICASTAYADVQRARAILNESLNGLFLDAWLTERVPNWQPGLSIASTPEITDGR